jgi:hypothetical protein
VQYRLEISGLTISQGGLELNLLRGANRRFIQPVTETAYNSYDADLPVRSKDHVEQNLTFNLKLAAFISVNRTRLECDFGG